MKTTAALALLCLYPVTGFSQTLTISSEYGLPIGSTTTEINETGTLSKLDSSLGTLTGATLIIYGECLTSFSGTNNAAQAQNSNLSGGSVLFFSSNESAVDNIIQSQNQSLDLYAQPGIRNYAVGQSISFGPYNISDSFTYDLTSVLSSVQVVGGGVFTINAQSLSGITILGGGGNISTTQSTEAGAGAKIIYSYTAVPEPSVSVLALLSLSAVFLRRRRA